MKNQSVIEKILSMRIGFWREFGICLAIALAARASMVFQLNLSVDDYLGLHYLNVPNFIFWHQEMRIFAYWTNIALHGIGSLYPYAGAFWPIFFNAALVYAGLLSMRIWVPFAGSIVFIAGASIFALFPYHSDYLTFQMAGPALGSMLIVGWTSLYFCLQSRRAGWISLVGLTYAVSGQITFVFLFFVVLFEGFVWAFRMTAETRWFRPGFLDAAKPWLSRMGLLFASVVLYVLINKAILYFLDIPAGARVVLSGLEEYPAKVLLVLKQSYFFLLKGEVAIPIAVKALQLVFFIFIAYAGALGILKNPRVGPSFILIWGACLFATIASIAASMGAVLPIRGEYGNMNPRSLSGLSMFWAGVYALTWAVNSGRARNVVAFLGIGLAFCYAVNANRQAVDHARINERDRMVASRMFERLSQLPGFEHVRTVVVLETHYRFNLDSITTETSGFNISALYRPMSSTAVLKEVSGWPFENPSKEDRLAAQVAAEGKPEWPFSGSVFIVEDIGVVVLPKKLGE